MHVIIVSNAYNNVMQGPWQDKDVAEQIAARWNRVFEQRGWSLRASVHGVFDKSAATRDRLGAILLEMAERALKDEMLRLDARPCECEGLDIAAGPDGLCACGHEPDEHSGEGCDGMVLLESVKAASQPPHKGET